MLTEAWRACTAAIATTTANAASASAIMPSARRGRPTKAKKARSKRKVQCTLTSMPENRPILKAPPMGPSCSS